MILGLGRLPGGGNGNPLQYSCLENPMDRGAWRATIHGVAKRHGLATEHAQMHLDGSLGTAGTTCLHLTRRCGMVRGGTFWAQAVPTRGRKAQGRGN